MSETLTNMTYADIVNFVREKQTSGKNKAKYEVVYSFDNEVVSKEQVRLFVTDKDILGKLNKGSRTRGTIFNLRKCMYSKKLGRMVDCELTSLKFIEGKKRKTEHQQFQDNCAKVIRHLEVDNLWDDFKTEIKVMQFMGYKLSKEIYNLRYTNFSRNIKDYDVNEKAKRINEIATELENKIETEVVDTDVKEVISNAVKSYEIIQNCQIHLQEGVNLDVLTDKVVFTGILTLANQFDIISECKIEKMQFAERVSNYYNEYALERIEKGIKNKQTTYVSGRAWYDVSFEYNAKRNKAWYSKEYRNCGNGHYYIALNHTHALFCEDD